MLKVKVCGLTEKVNISKIAEASPDIMGFIFYPGSVRYVGCSPDESIFNEIPSSILRAGVFVNDDPARVTRIARHYGLDLVQLHGSEPEDYCRSLKDDGLIIIKAFGIHNSFDFRVLQKYMDVCDYFLFDTGTGDQGGRGLKFNWTRLSEYDQGKPFILAGGIRLEDADLIKSLDHRSLFAVDINSCFEMSPGIKDPEKVKKFIEEIKYHNNELQG